MARDLRPGRWVTTPDGLGIVSAVSEGGVSVDLTDEDGQTERSDLYDFADVALADLDAIPASRRNPPRAKLSDPISEEENEAKNRAIAAGTFKES